MPAVAFDTLAFAKKLQEGGFTAQQAEVLASAQAELFEQNLATKSDITGLERTIREIEADLRRDMKEMETGLRRDIKELEARLTRDMKDLEYRMLTKLGSLMVVGITVVATLIKLL